MLSMYEVKGRKQEQLDSQNQLLSSLILNWIDQEGQIKEGTKQLMKCVRSRVTLHTKERKRRSDGRARKSLLERSSVSHMQITI